MARTLALLLACAAAADAAEVVRLDMDSWAELVAGSPHAWVIEFSSKYCETCKQFAPEWEKLTAGEGLVDGVRFGHVGIDDKPAKLLARELGAMKAVRPSTPARAPRPAPRQPPTTTAPLPRRCVRRRAFPMFRCCRAGASRSCR